MKVNLKYLAVYGLVVFLVGCVLAIPLMVKKYQGKDFVTVQFETKGKAADLYAKSVDYSKKQNPAMKILKDDRKNLSFEAENMKGTHKYDMQWEVEQMSDGKNSKFEFMVKIAEGDELIDKAEMNSLADSAVNNFCKALNQLCNIQPE